MPLIAKEFHNSPDEVPFDFPEIVASFAPRPFLACSPLHDSNFEVSGVRDCMAAAAPIYKLLGAEGICVRSTRISARLPPAVREVAYKFFEEHLRRNRAVAISNVPGSRGPPLVGSAEGPVLVFLALVPAGGFGPSRDI